MPIVIVKYDSERVALDTIDSLCVVLPGIIASALNVPGDASCELSEDEVEVDFLPYHIYAKNMSDFSILVFANAHPVRMANMKERTQEIVAEVQQRLAEITTRKLQGSVYIMPVQGSYMSI